MGPIPATQSPDPTPYKLNWIYKTCTHKEQHCGAEAWDDNRGYTSTTNHRSFDVHTDFIRPWAIPQAKLDLQLVFGKKKKKNDGATKAWENGGYTFTTYDSKCAADTDPTPITSSSESAFHSPTYTSKECAQIRGKKQKHAKKSQGEWSKWTQVQTTRKRGADGLDGLMATQRK